MPESLPGETSDALRAFGVSSLRAGIVNATVRGGEVTAQDLMSELGVGRSTLVPHTQALVDAGILVQGADPTKAGARAGFNRLVWRVDEQVLARHFARLGDAFGVRF